MNIKKVLFLMILNLLSINLVSAQPGSLDISFGNGGKVIGPNLLRPASNFLSEEVPDIAVQNDGKIVTVGTTNNVMTVFRFNSDGTPDNTFGTNGISTTDVYTGFSSTANAVAIQPDGKIIVGGSTNIPNSSQVNQNDLAIVRFNSNGSLDTGFGNGNGKYAINSATIERIREIVLQPDGKILFTADRLDRLGAFYVGKNIFAIRLLSNGVLDSTFGNGGTAAAPPFGDRSVCNFCGEESRSLVLQPDGKIVVVGKVNAFNGQFQNGLGFARFLSDGQLDNSFGTSGTVFSIFGTSQNPAQINYEFNTLALQTDGKFVVGGSGNSTNNPKDFAVFRYTSTGEFDMTFDGDGIALISVQPSNDVVNDIVIQPDGKIVAAGASAVNINGFILSNFALVRFNLDGSVDTTFGNDGKVITEFNEGDDDKISHAVLQADGKIIAVGYTQPNLGSGSIPKLALARYIAFTKRTPFDFDGDGRADVSVFRPSNGAWYINQSNAGFKGLVFGFGSDLPVPADYDGDGKTDVAVFRPSNGSWYYLRSSDNNFVGLQWGQDGDVPIPGDFDADRKADLNVFRPSDGAWYRLNSSNNQFVGNAFGQNGDIPLSGDFNGDGKADLAVFRPAAGAWYIAKPTGVPAQNFDTFIFGLGTDIPVPADYDGDGKTDVAVFRPSNGAWYRLNSSNGAFFGTLFGQNGDIPTAADYDGDGKADIAVFRNGSWYRLNSSNGGFVGLTFGFGTDKPIPAVFQ